MTIDETIAIAALIQAITAKLYKLREDNLSFISYKKSLINENKWRASRYGLDGKLIDFGKEMEVDTRSLIMEMLDFVDDVVDDLGSRHELEYINQILEMGTGADRQLKVYEETKSLEKVMEFIVEQTTEGT
jgi:carboxylate-amine ligase